MLLLVCQRKGLVLGILVCASTQKDAHQALSRVCINSR